MIRPFPLANNSESWTLLPGLSSKSSVVGMASPAWTIVAVVAWKFRRVVMGLVRVEVARLKKRREDVARRMFVEVYI